MRRVPASPPPTARGQEPAPARTGPSDLRHRPLRDVRVGAVVLAVALGGFGAWAALVPLTEGVVAVGTVAGATEHQVIQHLEGGIVETVHVREGSEVAAGDILLELRDTQARAERERLDTRAVGLRAELARLEAERQERDEIAFVTELIARQAEPEVTALLAAQRDLFAMRRRQYRGRIALLRHRIEQYEERIRGLEASRTAHQREHVLIERDVDTLRALHARQLVDEGTLIARQRESEQTAGRIGSLTAEIAAAQVAIGETQQEILQLEHTRHTEVAERLSAAQQEWYATRERLVAVQDVLTRTRIVAPEAGKVIGLTAHTVGGVIPPGEPILHLVPSDTPLIVEGRIRPTDIDRVQAGQTARLRFSAFSARTTPTVQGQVVRVSPDAFQDEVTQEAYYAARITVTDAELAKLGDVQLEPGMPVDVLVEGEQRTAWAYLTAPLVDIVEKAWVEE